MLSKIADTIKEPVAGITASSAFLTISFADMLQILQIISAGLAIVVALLTAYLTVLKIKKEKYGSKEEK